MELVGSIRRWIKKLFERSIFMKIYDIACHHLGGIASDPYLSTIDFTAEDVDRRHKAQWEFKSSLGKFGGYSILIEKTGHWTQFRALGEELASVKGRNLDIISIALSGNFNLKPDGQPVDKPTIAQQITLKNILIAL